MNAIAVTSMRTLIERLGITSSVMEDEGRHTHSAAASEAASELTRMTGEIERLKRALVPFVAWLEKLEPEFANHDASIIVGGWKGTAVTFGDLRRARAALEAKP